MYEVCTYQICIAVCLARSRPIGNSRRESLTLLPNFSPFTAPPNPLIHVSELYSNRPGTEFEALNWLSIRSVPQHPTDPFTILELQSPSYDVPKLCT